MTGYIGTLQTIAMIVALTQLVRYAFPKLANAAVIGVAILVGIALNVSVFLFAEAAWFGFVAKGLVDGLTAAGVVTGIKLMAPTMTSVANYPTDTSAATVEKTIGEAVARQRDTKTGRFTRSQA